MKKVFSWILAVTLLLSLAGCGTAAEPAPRDTSAVVIAIGTEPETLDPTKGWGHGNAPIVQSTLVRYTAQLSFENDLAVDYALDETLIPKLQEAAHQAVAQRDAQ